MQLSVLDAILKMALWWLLRNGPQDMTEVNYRNIFINESSLLFTISSGVDLSRNLGSI